MVGIVDGQEGFGAAQIVTLACMALQEFAQRRLAAVERSAIMFFADRLLMPCRQAHDFFLVNARAAACNLAFGLGGFSRTFRTRRLSLAERRICSACSMTALALRKACRRTKSVRSVFSSAAARRSIAFSSARTRMDIRSLSSTATLGIASLLSFYCTHSNSTDNVSGRQCLCGLTTLYVK